MIHWWGEITHRVEIDQADKQVVPLIAYLPWVFILAWIM
jgi:hypothetical protein